MEYGILKEREEESPGASAVDLSASMPFPILYHQEGNY
jgi:hypothetical protein